MAKDDDGQTIAVRFDGEEVQTLKTALRIGAAASLSEAIRIAVRYLPRALADKFLEHDLPALTQKIDELKRELERLPTPEPEPNAMGGYTVEQLKALATLDPTKYAPLRNLAQKELLHRGYFPNGLGEWVENHPELTRLVPAAPIRKGPPARR